MEPTRKAIAAVVLALCLLVPTGAATLGTDDVFGDDSIVLEPHDGPNGAYAEVGDDGNLSVDLGNPGVNQEARTVVEDVFNVSNHGSTSASVWVTHDATGHVTILDEESALIQGEENNVTLAPGETLVVSLRIDSESAAAGDVLLDEIEVHARIEDEEEEETTTVSSGAGAGGAAPATAEPTPTAPQTPAPTPAPEAPTPVEEVEVDFEDDGTGVDAGDAEGVTVVELDVSELDELPGESDDAGPRAVVRVAEADAEPSADGDEGTPTAQQDTGDAARDERIQQRLRAAGADALAQVGEPVSLSGEQSLLGSTRGIDNERRIVKAVDVSVPQGRENRPATIRIATERSKFAGTDIEEASIAHRTDEGWQLLDTRVVRATENQVVLEARTQGFSPFAVFADNDVTYSWELPNGETFVGKQVRAQFDDPGFYNVSLTVTDSFGRSSTAPYRILVNDPPAVTVETVGNVTAGSPVTLRANVDNEIGDVNVTWTFPDGTELTGEEVQHTFEAGEHVVEVTAEDEFGATEATELTVQVPPAEGGDPYLGVDGFAGSFEAWLALVALLVLLLLALRRWAGGIPAGVGGPLRGMLPGAIRGNPPRITAFESPKVDLANARFEVGRLRVEDRDDDIERVAIVVSDFRGNEVGREVIEVGGEPVHASQNVVVTPASRVYVRPGQEYRFRVTATDGRGATHERSRTLTADAGSRDRRPPGLAPGSPAD